jgi:hypothetical protein
LRFIFRFGFHADWSRRRFEKSSARPVARFQLTRSHARSSRHRGTLYQSQLAKKRFASPFFRPRPLFPGPFPVRDTFSKIGVPTDEQAKAYIAMLNSTASLKGEVAPASIFDFSLAEAAAKELAQKKWRIRAASNHGVSADAAARYSLETKS